MIFKFILWNVQCFVFLNVFFSIVSNTALTTNRYTREMEIMKIVITYAEDSVIKPHMQMRKYNRTHTAFSYNCTITKIIDDKFRYDLEVQKWGDGGWKKNLIKYGNKDPCNSMKFTLGPNFKHVMIQSNHSQDCPFVPGFYHFTDYCIEATKSPLTLQAGITKAIINIYEKQKWHLKILIKVSVVDRF